MATQNENPQLPQSKSSRLPEEILFQSFNTNYQGTIIQQKMKDFEFKVARTNLEDRILQVRSIFDRSLKDHKRDNGDILRQMFERKAVELVRSACAPEFLKSHSRQLATIETFEEAVKFLEGCFESETEEERKRDAEIDLENLARNVKDNEKFVSFLQRIKTLAKVIDSRPAAADFITESKFRKCIEPRNSQFLMDQGQHKGSIESVASFLDERNRHKTVTVAANEAFDMRAFMDTQSELLRSLIKEDRREIEKANANKNQEFASAIEKLTATVNELKLERAKVQNQAPTNFESFAQNRSPNFVQNQPQNFVQTRSQAFAPNQVGMPYGQQGQRFQQQGQSGQYGQPMINSQNQRAPFCSQCGKYGHIKRRCREIRCFKCGGLGHVFADCNKPDVAPGQQIQALARSHQETSQNTPPRQNQGN